MKCLLPLAVIAFLPVTHALAQSDATKSAKLAGHGAAPQHALPSLSEATLALSPAEALPKIEKLQHTLAQEPNNKDCRLQLALALESLGLFWDQKHDYLKSSRYYQGAARVFDLPGEKGWKKRSELDAKRAASSYKEHIEHLRSLKIEGFVFTSFDWHGYKNLDRKAAADYQAAVGQPIRINWSLAKRLQRLELREDQKKLLKIGFDVHRDGTVSDIKVVTPCGNPKIEEAAMQAIKDVGKVTPLLPALGNVVHFESQFMK